MHFCLLQCGGAPIDCFLASASVARVAVSAKYCVTLDHVSRSNLLGPSQKNSKMAAPRHTILLVQYTSNPSSRTFQDYDTVTGAMDGA